MNNSIPVELDKDFDIKDRLFHYTSAEGLYGILQSGCLWATHFKFLNDSNEFFAARDSLTVFVQSQIRKEISDLIELKRHPLAGSASLDDLCKHEAEVIVSNMYKATLSLAAPFIFSSFVSNPMERSFRNGELLHWATYGREGGYALEINPHKLASILPRASVLSLKAVYVDGSIPKQLSAEYSDIGKVAQEMIVGIANGNLEEVDIGGSASPFMKVASIIKDDYFTSENEARLVYMRFKDHSSEEGQPEVLIRHQRGRAIPYIKLFADVLLGSKSPVEAIIIGPHPDRVHRKEALSIYLEARGLQHIEIVQSEVPYIGG